MTRREIEAIVIGGSAGSLDALLAIVPGLPGSFPIPIAIVLHVAPSRPSLIAELLASRSSLPVREVEDKEPILPGTIYVAPPNYHLLVERHRTFALSVDGLVHYARPSIDVLFESAADAYGPALAGLVLSGANDDGAEGLLRIHEAGGIALVQDPSTASAAMMPEAARRRLGGAARTLAVDEIAGFLAGLADATSMGGKGP